VPLEVSAVSVVSVATDRARGLLVRRDRDVSGTAPEAVDASRSGLCGPLLSGSAFTSCVPDSGCPLVSLHPGASRCRSLVIVRGVRLQVGGPVFRTSCCESLWRAVACICSSRQRTANPPAPVRWGISLSHGVSRAQAKARRRSGPRPARRSASLRRPRSQRLPADPIPGQNDDQHGPGTRQRTCPPRSVGGRTVDRTPPRPERQPVRGRGVWVGTSNAGACPRWHAADGSHETSPSDVEDQVAGSVALTPERRPGRRS
jgi:hypothetical protein